MIASKIPSNDMPVQPTNMKAEEGTNAGQFNIDLFMWKDKYKEWFEKAKHIEEGNKKLYSLFDKQCSPGMKTQVEGLSDFNLTKIEQYGIKLLGIIQDNMRGEHQHLHNTWAMVKE